MSKRGWIFLLSAIPLIGFLALLGWASLRSDGNPGGLGVNNDFGQVDISSQPAAEFTLTLSTGTLNSGTELSLSDLRGKVVLVDFWASWCTPCRQEAAGLSRVYLEYAGKPVEFVGVNIWDRDQDALDFLEAFQISYPNGVDEAGRIAIDYGVRGIPEKFFIDQKGVVRQKFVGPMQAEALREAIDGLLSADPPPAKDATIETY
jgi:cytochrome c biogenesis protein CcmG/thiol:disulfide interchange protein DsbE